MSLTLEDGTTVNVEEANQAFARAMTATPDDDQPIAPAPPKVEKKEPAPRPAARKPAPKKNTKTISAPASKAVHDKRVQAGADILHTLAVVTESFHMATGDEAWHKDTELFAATAPQFGEALANVADHNPAFARYLDNDSTGAAGAYLALGLMSTQIAMAVVDNHNARGKIPVFIQGVGLKIRGFLSNRKARKPNANPVPIKR